MRTRTSPLRSLATPSQYLLLLLLIVPLPSPAARTPERPFSSRSLAQSPDLVLSTQTANVSETDDYRLPTNVEYRPVFTGAELTSLLASPTPALKYLTIAPEVDVLRLVGDGLASAPFTTAIINCHDTVLDLQATDTFTVNPSTSMQFYSCKIFAPDSTAAWSDSAIFFNSAIIHPCSEDSDDVIQDWASGNRDAPIVIANLVVEIPPGHTATWINSTAVCLTEAEVAAQLAELDAHSTSSGLPAFAIILLVAGGVLVSAGVVVAALWWCRRRPVAEGPTKGPESACSSLAPAYLRAANDPSVHGTSGSAKNSYSTSERSKSRKRSDGSGIELRTHGMLNDSASDLPTESTHTDSQTPTPQTPSHTRRSPSPVYDSCYPSHLRTPASEGTLLRRGIEATKSQLRHDLPDEPLEVLELVGSGGYGNVYRGLWKGLEVAIKTVVFQDSEGSDGSARVSRVYSEAAIASNMAHPNIINTFSHELKQMSSALEGELVDYKLYLIQEFCRAGTLSQLIEGGHLRTNEGGVHMRRLLTILCQIASGMAHMHRLRMVHGDLNPTNVLLQVGERQARATESRPGSGRVAPKWEPLIAEAASGLDCGTCAAKLSDFGLSVQLQRNCSHVSNVKHGTPFYCAPEIKLKHRLQCESDLYSFGVIMWELYTSTLPFVLRRGSHCPHPDFGKFPPHAPLNFALLTAACLSQQPAERPSFPSVLQVLEALEGELDKGSYTDLCGHSQATELLFQQRDSLDNFEVEPCASTASQAASTKQHDL